MPEVKTTRLLCTHWFFVLLSFIPRGYSGSLRIPIKGQLVYDTVSKTGNLCVSPLMCPSCILNSLCQLDKPIATSTSTPHSTEESSSPTTSSSPTMSPASSSTAATETTATSSTQVTPTTEPTETSTVKSTTPTEAATTAGGTATTEESETTTAKSTRPTEAVTTTEDFFQNGLQVHNKYRKIHDAPALKLNSKLNSDAQATAERIASQGSLVHTDDTGGQGESLAKFCTPYELNPDEISTRAVDKWYKEVCKYDFDNPGWSQSTGHFTQLVWRSTEEVGLGWSSKEENGLTCYYVAARYSPGGNIDSVSQFKENVKKGSFDSSFCEAAKKRSNKCYGKMVGFLFKTTLRHTRRGYRQISI